jgi:hypothetical protein
MMNSQCRTGLALLGMTLALAAAPCRASLGGAPSQFGAASVRQAHALAAVTPGAKAASYNVNATQLPNGTTVREYAAGGVVFAVAWEGPFLPDLRELLGRHFATLTDDSARQPMAGHNRIRIARPDVTIESGGHMRAYNGRAWVNGLLPAGFDTNEIQ